MDDLPDISPFRRRLDELAAQMASSSFYANPRRAADVTREHQRLIQLVSDHDTHTRLEKEVIEAREFERDLAADAELRELAAALEALKPPADSPNTQLSQQYKVLKEQILGKLLFLDRLDAKTTLLSNGFLTRGELKY